MVDPMSSVTSSLRLAPDLQARLETVARNEDRNASDIASEAIEAYVGAKEFKQLEIAAALAEADKGVFTSSESVHKWMESWDTDNELPMPEPDIFLPRRQWGSSI